MYTHSLTQNSVKQMDSTAGNGRRRLAFLFRNPSSLNFSTVELCISRAGSCKTLPMQHTQTC